MAQPTTDLFVRVAQPGGTINCSVHSKNNLHDTPFEPRQGGAEHRREHLLATMRSLRPRILDTFVCPLCQICDEDVLPTMPGLESSLPGGGVASPCKLSSAVRSSTQVDIPAAVATECRNLPIIGQEQSLVPGRLEEQLELLQAGTCRKGQRLLH